MARRKVGVTSETVVERNIKLVGELMSYLLKQPQVFDSLPDDFELVILPDDDPEMRLYNLDLLDKYGSEGKPVVFARVKAHQKSRVDRTPLNLYVPVAA